MMKTWIGLAENCYKKFINAKIFCSIVFALAMILSVVFSAQADNSYLGIEELRENTPSTWTENLKGGKKNFDCTVDASIVVPEVDRFPILQIGYQGKIPDVEGKEYYVEENTERRLFVKTLLDETVTSGNVSQIDIVREDSLSEEFIQETEEKAREKLQKVWDMDGTALEKVGIVICQSPDTNYQEKVVFFYPVYNGITYLHYSGSRYIIKDYVLPPFNTIYASWREDVDYEAICFCMPRLIGEYVQDVPLCPFSKIQDTVRQYVQNGYVQRICEIRLGYICSGDPDHPGESFFLTPAWVVCGVINDEPNLPFYPEEYHQESRYESPLVIDAQTGEAIDFGSHNKETFNAHILTWDDVNK